MRTYFDSSAILDSILNPGARRLPTHVEQSDMFTSKLAQVEVLRNINRFNPELLNDAVAILNTFHFIDIHDRILNHASFYPQEITLKSSDAIHMATAELLLDIDDLLITYDKQMAHNAEHLGIKVLTTF